VESVSECNPKLRHKLEQCTGTFGNQKKTVRLRDKFFLQLVKIHKLISNTSGLGSFNTFDSYGTISFSSLVPRFRPAYRRFLYELRPASDDKLGGAWERGYTIISALLRSVVPIPLDYSLQQRDELTLIFRSDEQRHGMRRFVW